MRVVQLLLLAATCWAKGQWRYVSVLVDDELAHDLPAMANPVFQRCSYKGEHNQDERVLEFLGELRGGFFVEVGAHNGFFCSNTYRLEQDWGWQGICVEPAPQYLWWLSHRACQDWWTVGREALSFSRGPSRTGWLGSCGRAW